MANTADTGEQVGGWLDPLGIFPHSAGETSAQIAAREARQKALEQAQSQLDFNKAVYNQNNQTIDDLTAGLYGPDPNKLAQQYADERVANNAPIQGKSTGVTTPSGRAGTFDFGTGTAPGAPTSAAPASAPTAPGSGYTSTFQGDDGQVYQYGPGQTSGTPAGSAVPSSMQTSPAAASTPTAPKTNAITDADRARAAEAVKANYGNTLTGKLDTIAGRRNSIADSLKSAIDGIQRVDPGQYNSAWNVNDKRDYVSPEAKAAQKAAMDKTFALTDTKETAEEKLMREMSRRNQERDLRSSRDAQASQLRARGAYGSGAELAGFLGSQQELAQRRSLEELGADSNATKRAQQALATYGNQAFQLGSQDLQQGALQDVNSRFNSDSQQNFKKYQTKTQQEENDAAAKRAATKADVDLNNANADKNDLQWNTDTKIRLAGAKTGTNLASAAPIGGASSNLAGAFQDVANHKDAEDAANKQGFL